MRPLRDRLGSGLKAKPRSSFDLECIAVSSSAACSSGKVQPSHVLAVEIFPALVHGAVRVSLGWGTGEADIERCLGAWRKLATALSKGQAGMAA
jgi:cysteine desulfurase